MHAEPVQIFYPSTLTELFAAWNRYPQALLFSGGATLLAPEKTNAFHLPENVISMEKIDELRRISRTERYLEAGALVSLGEMLMLGKVVPQTLRETLEMTANANSRNILTVGGSVNNSGRLTDLAACFIALDARYELKSTYTSRWVSASRYPPHADLTITDGASDDANAGPSHDTILTRVRIPLDDWSFCRSRIFWTGPRVLSVFLARIQKNILSDLRLVFAVDKYALRDKSSEIYLSQKSLPLDKKNAAAFLEMWRELLDGLDYIDEFTALVILNHIESLMTHFTD
jgi:CO/xanthine dehydrogenase FAD-binding subunit